MMDLTANNANKIAREAAKEEVESIKEKIITAAQNKATCVIIESLSGGAKDQLELDGFEITNYYNRYLIKF